MKKLVAITLLIAHLFNFIGYPFLFRILIRQSDKKFTEKIDRHQYSDHELVEVKVALNAPYMTGWNNYERCDGEITIDGIHHNYVKRKISGDTLYMLCIPNKESTKLYAAKNDFGRNINDFSTGKKAFENIKKANVFNSYQEKDILYSVDSPIHLPSDFSVSTATKLSHSYLEPYGKPPEINS